MNSAICELKNPCLMKKPYNQSRRWKLPNSPNIFCLFPTQCNSIISDSNWGAYLIRNRLVINWKDGWENKKSNEKQLSQPYFVTIDVLCWLNFYDKVLLLCHELSAPVSSSSFIYWNFYASPIPSFVNVVWKSEM